MTQALVPYEATLSAESYFRNLACLRKIVIQPKPIWELVEPLIYVSKLAGIIVVPVGFRTDLGSVPRLPFMYLVAGGQADEACILHDWLYSLYWPREAADEIFREAILAMGYSEGLAGTMFAGVRLGGWYSYSQPNLPQPDEVNKIMEFEELGSP